MITMNILLAFVLDAGWDRHREQRELDRAIHVQTMARDAEATWLSSMSRDPTPEEAA